jgi:hypothetical protein
MACQVNNPYRAIAVISPTISARINSQYLRRDGRLVIGRLSGSRPGDPDADVETHLDIAAKDFFPNDVRDETGE